MPNELPQGDTARLAAWLRTAPALAWLRALWVDDVPAAPYTGGLFPAGAAATARRADILGRRVERRRARWVLRLVLPHGKSAANALCLEQLAAWVAAQSAAGKAPHFGSRDRETETLSAAGALESVSDEGTAVYAVTLQADYTVQCNEGGNT